MINDIKLMDRWVEDGLIDGEMNGCMDELQTYSRGVFSENSRAILS